MVVVSEEIKRKQKTKTKNKRKKHRKRREDERERKERKDTKKFLREQKSFRIGLDAALQPISFEFAFFVPSSSVFIPTSVLPVLPEKRRLRKKRWIKVEDNKERFFNGYIDIDQSTRQSFGKPR